MQTLSEDKKDKELMNLFGQRFVSRLDDFVLLKEKSIGLSTIIKIGTARSGNRGHAGRPGHVGGSGGGSFGRGVLNLTPEQMAANKSALGQMDKDVFNRKGPQYGNEYQYANALAYDNKKQVQELLSEKLTGIPGIDNKEDAGIYVKHRIDQWASSSGDTDAQSIGMQIAAKEHFKLNEASLDHLGDNLDKQSLESTDYDRSNTFRDAKFNIEDPRPLSDGKTYKLKDVHSAFLQTQYDATQKYFKDNNIKELVLYRGVEHHDAGKLREEEIQLQPISSFSVSPLQAMGFAKISGNFKPASNAGTVYASVVPVEKILSHPRTGFGCTGEKEVTVLGGKIRSTIIPTEIAWGVYQTARNMAMRDMKNPDFNNNFLASLNKVQPAFREKAMKKEALYNIDANLNDADWVKKTWDLPEYSSKEFDEFLQASGTTLEKFKKLPVYKWAVERGEIKS